MWYLLTTFPLWILLALVLGLIVGWLSWSHGPSAGFRGYLFWGAGLAAAALVSLFKLVPDRLGYWFDLGLLMALAYVIGCWLAGLVRASQSRTEALPTPSVTKAVAPVVARAAEVPVEPAKPGSEPVATEAIEEAITGLSAPRGGKGDDLTKIYGIDAATQRKLNALGLYHYDQLASLTPGNRRWLFRQLGHEGRFPSWWWRWRYDAEQLAAGTGKSGAAPAKSARKAPTPVPADKPLAVAALPEEGSFEGAKPAGLAAPRGGKADDLKRIRGIGKQNEGRLHGLGVWHFDQIAAWTSDEVTWVGGYLAFPGRIEREDWVAQAKVLAAGGATEFSKRADAGKVATSRDDTNDDGQTNVAKLGADFGAKSKSSKTGAATAKSAKGKGESSKS